jgi:heat shock protein HslJ
MLKNKSWIITLLISLLAACSGTKIKLSTEKNTDRNIGLLEKGVSFWAYGQEPFWNLEVYDGKEVRFEGMNNQLFTSPTARILPTDSQTYFLTYNTPNGKFNIMVLHQPCTDVSSGEKHPITVAALYGKDTLMGCGMNIYDKRINGKWLLNKINGKNIPTQLGQNNIPHLDINGELKTISGSTGCNRLSGKFVLRNYNVLMGSMATTKMACPNAMESAFLAVFNHIISYQISNNNLLLINNEEVTCEFIKTK